MKNDLTHNLAYPLCVWRKTIRCLLCLPWLLWLPLFSGTALANTEWTVPQLMQCLAKVKNDHVLFQEKRYLSILDTPLSSSGEMFYRAPDYLEQRTLKPQPQRLILDKDQIELQQQGKIWQFSVNQRPEISQFIDSMRGTLSGDETLLQRQFTLQLHGDQQNWTLIMTPRDTTLLHGISRIEIDGSDSHLSRIQYRNSNGDHAVITLQPAVPLQP